MILTLSLNALIADKEGKVWLFSRRTLNFIPDVFEELSTPPVEKILPEFLVKTRLVDIPVFEWLAVFVGMPFLCLLTVLLNRLIMLLQHPNVDLSTVRVNFLRINTFSLDLDIVAYVLVRDWDDFFQIQEELLLNVMNIVKQEGAAIAFPSQTMYFAAHSSDILPHLSPEFARRDESETLRDEAGVHH